MRLVAGTLVIAFVAERSPVAGDRHERGVAKAKARQVAVAMTNAIAPTAPAVVPEIADGRAAESG